MKTNFKFTEVVTKYKTESSLLLTEERTRTAVGLWFTNTQDIVPLCMAFSLETNPHPQRSHLSLGYAQISPEESRSWRMPS